MFNKKMIYDGLGIANTYLSDACYFLSRTCVKMELPRAAMTCFNVGNDRARSMMKYWIKSMNYEENLEVERVAN